jgi:hypothetical protein
VSLWATIILVGFFVIGLTARADAGRRPIRVAVLLTAVVLVAMRGLVW